MKSIWAVFILLIVAPVLAQANGSLRIFTDSALTDSTLIDDQPRIVSVYIAHTDFQASVGVIFSTVASPGFTGVWVSETSQFLNIGTTPTGINVGYGACLSGPVIVATAEYQMFGTSSCSQLSIAPFPDFLGIVCLECFYEYTCVNNGRLLVDCAVPVEPTTWGKVKALYRN